MSMAALGTPLRLPGAARPALRPLRRLRPSAYHAAPSAPWAPDVLPIRSKSRGRHAAEQRVCAATATAPGGPPVPSGGSGSGGAFADLANLLTSFFPVWVLGSTLWALLQPSAFSWFKPAAITPALAVTMLGMGLTLTFEDFRRVLATPGRIFAGFALQYSIMPAMGFLVSRLMGLSLEYTIGLCLVGSCPGGTASNVVTYLARADVTLSVAMTTASTLGAVVATPLLTKLLLGTLVPVDALGLLLSTLQVVLLPVLAGAVLNQVFPRAVAVLSPLCALGAAGLIALICGSVIAQNAAAVLAAGPRLLAAIFALHAGGFFFGYAFSKVLGLPERAARTNSIEVGMQNSALGALLASVHFSAHPLAAVPCAISACMHSVLGSLLAAWWRGRPLPEDDEREPPTAAAAAAGATPPAAPPAAPSQGPGAQRQPPPLGDSGGSSCGAKAGAVLFTGGVGSASWKVAAAGAAAQEGPSAAATVTATTTDLAARVAKAPASVQAFIGRWGRREGIEAAHAAAEAAQRLRLAGARQDLAGKEELLAREAACGLASDPEAAAARLALAPPSVQDFIRRWGRREGIDAAAARQVSWEAAVLETMDEVPGHHTVSSREEAFMAREEAEAAAAALPAAGPLVDYSDPARAAQRLALAPPRARAFIERWGRWEGIDAAAAAAASSMRAPTAAAGAPAAAREGRGKDSSPSFLAGARSFVGKWTGIDPVTPAERREGSKSQPQGAQEAAGPTGMGDERAKRLWRPDLRCDIE